MRTKSLLALAVLSLSFSSVYAQNEEKVLNSDPINVDGYLAEEKPVTDNELQQIRSEIGRQKTEVQLNKEKTKSFKELSKTTEKLSDVTEEYIDEKKSAQKDIAEYNAKIKCLMEENPGKDCDKYVRNRKNKEEVVQEVNVGQAAPSAAATSTTVAAPTVATGENPFEVIKLLAFAGGTQFNGATEQLESELSGGLRLESNINRRFSMGLGFNYTQLKTQDFANNFYGNQVYSAGYYGTYGAQGREIQYQSYGIDLYGKFFITNGERFRPYLGAGIGYNTANMKYSQNSSYNYTTPGYGYQFGNENYKTSFARGSLFAGSEIMVTQSFGFNIEGAFSTGLGDGNSSRASQNFGTSPDQARLRQLGKDIINANSLSVFAGAVIVF